MKSCKNFISFFFSLAAAVCAFGLTSHAQQTAVTYDFKVHGSGSGLTKQSALEDAIKNAKANCGMTADLVGVNGVQYQPDHSSDTDWAFIDGYCKWRDTTGNTQVVDDINGKGLDGTFNYAPTVPPRPNLEEIFAQ